MATTYTTKSTGDKVTVIVRVQRTTPQVNQRRSTGITMSANAWSALKECLDMKDLKEAKIQACENNADKDRLLLLYDLRKKLDAASKVELTAKQMKVIVDQCVNAELYEKRRQLEEERKAEEEAKAEEERKRVTFMEYYRNFLNDIKANRVDSRNGKKFARRSFLNYQQGYNKLLKYQQQRGVTVNWNDIDLVFLDDYKAFLRSEEYSINTICKRVTEIKHLVHMAHDRGITDCHIYDNLFFGMRTDNDIDSIYLTPDDIEAIKAVDLSDKPISYTFVRDLFVLGCFTAQRISDYGHLKPENIITEREKVVVEDAAGDRIEVVERKYLRVTQKKTGAKVVVPCNAEVCAILAKYPDGLPSVCDQVFNRYLKEITQRAGLDELVEVKSTKGGKVTRKMLPKWQLCHSHTARRTGATLMFLAGIEAHDICRITGHGSIRMLNKYIRAGELEAAKKLSNKYDFFK